MGHEDIQQRLAARPLPPLGDEESRRYGRQMVLEEIGAEGQRRLKSSRVLVVGAGGLGSPLATYLAAAGVGTLGLADFDEVDLSNLHRQPLHGTPDLGRPKLESAAERLRAINPHVELELHHTRVDASNARELVAAYDLVADGSDNFGTRYVVNDACVLEGRPNAYAAVLQFEGQASVFAAPGGPCYRCLYPEPPPPGSIPGCAEAGVLGVLPGVLGLVQANEVLKLLLGIGEPLVGRLLLFDALDARFRELKLPRDPACPACGDSATIDEVVEPEGYCDPREAAPAAPAGAKGEGPMEVEELASRLGAPGAPVLVDVRTPAELSIASIEGALHMPLHLVPVRMAELDPTGEIAVICHSGMRSAQAVQFLQQHGFAHARNVEGGIDAWSRLVDPAVPRY